jgi:hypothetical protein
VQVTGDAEQLGKMRAAPPFPLALLIEMSSGDARTSCCAFEASAAQRAIVTEKFGEVAHVPSSEHLAQIGA